MRTITVCIAVSFLAVMSCVTSQDKHDGGLDAARPSDAGSDAASDGGGSTDAAYQCHFDPLANHSSIGGGGVSCQFSECPMWYQRMVDGGVAYGGCGAEFVPGVCIADVCVPVSEVATLSDGGQAPEGAGWAALCCGDGPACACDEICWAPNATDAPHCVPM